MAVASSYVQTLRDRHNEKQLKDFLDGHVALLKF